MQAIPSAYQGIVDIIKSTTASLADFISTALVDAFDPTKDLNIQERFARFLQDIAKQVLQLFTQLAIARALLGFGFGAATGGGGGLVGLLGGIGFNKGGIVPASHGRARGYAEGGSVRPAGVSPKDTVAAWLQPQEHVMPVNRVKQYGADLLERIRHGLVDPSSLRAAAGLSGGRSRRVTASRGPGYAKGGVVGQGISSNRQREQNNGATQQATPAYIVSNEKSVETFLAGGPNAMRALLRNNKDYLRALVR